MIDTSDVVKEWLIHTVDALCTCDYLIPSSVEAFASYDHKPECVYVAFLKHGAGLVELPEVKALVEAIDLLLAEAVEQNECVEDVPVELWDQVTSSLAAIKEPQ